MNNTNFRTFLTLVLVSLCTMSCSFNSTSYEKREKLQQDSRKALEALYASTPGAKALGETAKGILVFPDIVKGGFIVGGQYGQGILLKEDRLSGYYNSVSGSFGLQAGVQKFGYVMFFMSDSDLAYLNESEGWEIGVGPSVTIIDKGMASSLTSTTLRKGVYAFFFEQRGLMAGIGLQGTKISKITE